MEKRLCAGCGQEFFVRSNVPGQRYCSTLECQKVRKRRWQAARMVVDSDYRTNQQSAQTEWRKRHSDYWREYRASHPEYTSCNRCRQRQRNRRRRGLLIAKMDE